MKHSVVIPAIILLCSGGCVSHHPAPITWEQAIRPGSDATDALSGNYYDFGEMNAISGTGRGRYLHEYFFKIGALSPLPNIVRLTLQDSRRLKVEALQGEVLIGSQVADIQLEGGSSSRGRSIWVKAPTVSGTSNLGASWTASNIRLYRGSDGHLYGELRQNWGGLFGFFLPIYNAETQWVKWEKLPQ